MRLEKIDKSSDSTGLVFMLKTLFFRYWGGAGREGMESCDFGVVEPTGYGP